MTTADTTFGTRQQQWRDRRREALLAVEGWASLVGLHWLEPGPQTVGRGDGNAVRLMLGPAGLGTLDVQPGGRVRFIPAPGADVAVDGAPVRGEAWLAHDGAGTTPGRLEFDGGRGVATVVIRNDRHALRVRHQDAPTRTGFGTLDYWPADPAWVLPARLEPHAEGATLQVPNILGGVETMPNPGVLVFERDGRRYRLEALDQGGETLFVVFADATTGAGSYHRGRFLQAPRPGPDGMLELDLNQAYNPPSAFTAFATCPLPPEGNRLDLAVTAGEKAYRARED